MNRSDLQGIALLRVIEARKLFDAGAPSGAYYLAGYALECGLKACIARRTQEHDFPDKQLANESYTHDLEKLVKVAKLDDALRLALRSDPQFRNQWDTVVAWSETSRYAFYEIRTARAMLLAVGGEKDGVLGWITQHW